MSRRKARDVIEKGQVTVAGTTVREPGREVEEGGVVDFDPNRRALSRARCTLPVLHEDEHVIVVDKPAGLLTVPSAPGVHDETPPSGACRTTPTGGRPGRLRGARAPPRPRHVGPRSRSPSRGKPGGAHPDLPRPPHRAALSRDRRGEPKGESGAVDVALREAWVSGRRGVAKAGEEAESARTRWRVLERLSGAALLEVELETGRQHQIRVHLAHVGLPILGDPVYGRPPAAGPPRDGPCSTPSGSPSPTRSRVRGSTSCARPSGLPEGPRPVAPVPPG